MWLQADGCRLRVDSPAGPLVDVAVHDLDPGEVIRWIRPKRILDDGEVIPAQAYRLAVQTSWPGMLDP